MKIRTDRNGRAKAGGPQRSAQPRSQLRWRAEEAFCASNIENKDACGSAAGFFYTRRELCSTLQQDGASGSLALQRARQQHQACQALHFKTRHTQHDAAQACMPVQRTYRFIRRLALQHNHWLGLQVRPQAQQCLGGKLRGMNAGIQSTAHARFSASHAASAAQLVSGGLRLWISSGSKRSRLRSKINSKPRSTVSPAATACADWHSSTIAAADCA